MLPESTAPPRVSSAESKLSLQKRFSIASFAVMLITAIVLILIYRQDKLNEFEKLSADENEKTLFNLLYKLESPVASYIDKSKSKERDPRSISQLDSLFDSGLRQINEHDILKLKIYDQSGIAIYSSSRSEIGESSQHQDLLSQALSGKTAHTPEFREKFLSRNGEMHDVYIFVTYMPIVHNGNQIGVMESYDDAAETFRNLNNKTAQIGLVVAASFALLYLVLYYSLVRTDRDIARWQERIAKNEELLNESQSIAGLGSYELDLISGLIECTHSLERVFGIDQSYEHSLTGWEALIHPDDREKTVDQFRNEVLALHENFDLEYRIIRRSDQSVRWIHGLCILELDAHGKPKNIHGTVQDITSLKEREEEQRIAAIAFESQEGIIVTDAKCSIIKANRAMTKLSGYSNEELLGKNPKIFSSGKQGEDFYTAMWESINYTGSWAGEVWDRRKNGESYPKWLIITAVKDAKGEVTHYIGSQSDITNRKIAEDKIKNMAFFDPLTNLPNRRLLMDRLQHALSACARSGREGALLFIDLDNFKPLNDTHGHKAGDLLLMEAAQRITGCVREMDTVARFGGDEFVVVLSELDEGHGESAKHAGIVAEKIHATLMEPYWLTNYGHGSTQMIVNHHCGASIGVVLFSCNSNAENVLKWADKAMYQAKEAGKNLIRFYVSD